jgi:hypothetical protein
MTLITGVPPYRPTINTEKYFKYQIKIFLKQYL